MSKDNLGSGLDIVGMGNAIVDVLSRTEDRFLEVNSLDKGAMILIEAEQAEKIYAGMGPGMEMSGGSAANTIAAFASMGGNGGFMGKVANDQLGKVFGHDIRAAGVKFDTPTLSDGTPTARCLVLITPDGQRTMCTFLGAAVWMSPADLSEEMIKNAKVTYLEGYLFDRDRAKQAFRKGSEIAHAAGRKVALSLCDTFCVERHREEFQDLVQSHVDIVFANEGELLSLYSTQDFDEAVFHARQHCDVAAVTRGEKGSVIITKNEIIQVAPEPVTQVVDTTGAGDLYAAGFLYGYTRDLPLAQCGRIASIAAAEIITQIGARPQRSLEKLLKEKKAV